MAQIKNFKRAVYKLKHAGRTYYRVGHSPADARNRLARELRVKPEIVEILDGGKGQ